MNRPCSKRCRVPALVALLRALVVLLLVVTPMLPLLVAAVRHHRQVQRLAVARQVVALDPILQSRPRN